MRTGAKLGVVISLVVVLVAGGYFMARDEQGQPIALDGTSGSMAGRDNRAEKPPRKTATRRGANHAKQRNGRPGLVDNPRKVDSVSATPNGRAMTSGGAATPRPGISGGESPATPTPGNDLIASKGRSSALSPAATTPKKLAHRTGKATTQPDAARHRSALPEGRPSESRASGKARGGVSARRLPADPKYPVSGGKGTRIAGNVALSGTPSPLADTTLSAMPAPAAAIDMHRIQPGDTLASLASMYYGGERYVQFLASANPQLGNPNALRVGALIRIPALPDSATTVDTSAATRGGQPSSKAGAAQRRTDTSRTYRVKSGDSFYVIARDVLGDAMRWKELFELNRDLVKGDPTRLQVGQIIKLRE